MARTLTLLLTVLLTTVPAAGQPADGEDDEHHALAWLPRYDSTSALDRFYYFELDTGVGFDADRVRRDPRQVRVRRLRDNLFTVIGRPTTDPAARGEILLAPLFNSDDSVRGALFVETSTGYVAYFDDLGKGGRFGEITTTIGRTFGDLAATDGNFVLWAPRASNGRSANAVLYHGTSGRAVALRDVDERPSKPVTIEIDDLPKLDGRASSVVLERSGGGTDGYLLFDEASGTIYRIGLDARALPIAAVAQTFGLFDVFPREATRAADPRFVPISVRVSNQITRHVLIVDVGSGEMAWLANVDGALAAPSLQALTIDLSRQLNAGGDGSRTIAAIPRTVVDGSTVGAWLLDGLTGSMIYLDNLDRPAELSASAVTIER